MQSPLSFRRRGGLKSRHTQSPQIGGTRSQSPQFGGTLAQSPRIGSTPAQPPRAKITEPPPPARTAYRQSPLAGRGMRSRAARLRPPGPCRVPEGGRPRRLLWGCRRRTRAAVWSQLWTRPARGRRRGGAVSVATVKRAGADLAARAAAWTQCARESTSPSSCGLGCPESLPLSKCVNEINIEADKRKIGRNQKPVQRKHRDSSIRRSSIRRSAILPTLGSGLTSRRSLPAFSHHDCGFPSATP
jgi:hypothetical protein